MKFRIVLTQFQRFYHYNTVSLRQVSFSHFILTTLVHPRKFKKYDSVSRVRSVPLYLVEKIHAEHTSTCSLSKSNINRSTGGSRPNTTLLSPLYNSFPLIFKNHQICCYVKHHYVKLYSITYTGLLGLVLFKLCVEFYTVNVLSKHIRTMPTSSKLNFVDYLTLFNSVIIV